MRTALYIENGYTQVVLTAENDFEKSALAQLNTAPAVKITEGGFYHCQGGYVRQSYQFADRDCEPNSIMLVIQKEAAK